LTELRVRGRLAAMAGGHRVTPGILASPKAMLPRLPWPLGQRSLLVLPLKSFSGAPFSVAALPGPAGRARPGAADGLRLSPGPSHHPSQPGPAQEDPNCRHALPLAGRGLRLRGAAFGGRGPGGAVLRRGGHVASRGPPLPGQCLGQWAGRGGCSSGLHGVPSGSLRGDPGQPAHRRAPLQSDGTYPPGPLGRGAHRLRVQGHPGRGGVEPLPGGGLGTGLPAHPGGLAPGALPGAEHYLGGRAAEAGGEKPR